MTKIQADQELTKADLEMAVFLSRGEVDRYRIMLEHDIRTYELMNPDPAVMKADTVRMPMSGLLVHSSARGIADEIREYVYEPRHAYLTADASVSADDVIRSEDVVQDGVDETGTLYRAPVM